MSLARNPYLWLILILLLAFSLRLSYLLEFRSTPFYNASLMKGMDQRTFDLWAEDIVKHPFVGDGKPFYQAPGYPYFLAAIYKVFGRNYFAVGLIQIILDTILCLLLFCLGKKIFNPLTGILAAFLGALYRPFIFYSVTLLSDSLILFLSLLTLTSLYWALFRFRNSRFKIGDWALTGFIFGLATLTKPTILLFLPVALLSPFLFRTKLSDIRPKNGVAVPAKAGIALLSLRGVKRRSNLKGLPRLLTQARNDKEKAKRALPLHLGYTYKSWKGRTTKSNKKEGKGEVLWQTILFGPFNFPKK